MVSVWFRPETEEHALGLGEVADAGIHGGYALVDLVHHHLVQVDGIGEVFLEGAAGHGDLVFDRDEAGVLFGRVLGVIRPFHIELGKLQGEVVEHRDPSADICFTNLPN